MLIRYGLRIDQQIYDKAKQLARTNGQSLNFWITRAITDAITRATTPAKEQQ